MKKTSLTTEVPIFKKLPFFLLIFSDENNVANLVSGMRGNVSKDCVSCPNEQVVSIESE